MNNTVQIGMFTINVWSCFVALGFILGIILFRKYAQQGGMSSNHVWNIAIITIVCGIIGSRFLYVLENFSEFSGNVFLMLDLFHKTGLSFFGGFILSISGIAIYVKRYLKDISVWQIFDMLAIPILAGMTIGRIGCYLVHDHVGKTISGVQYNPALCLALTNFFLLLIFLYLHDKIKQKGVLAISVIGAIGLSRFGWDFLRIERRYWGLTVGQVVAVGVMVIGMIFVILRTPSPPDPSPYLLDN